ncbi:MAG: Flp pilus assembly complex ATPase component TadA [Candidatus Diapherotrites archaeon]|nr:Flp pilus assembly complex ATPase component TadA [Candidatus Diapherotrites archaeon]
MVAQYRPGRISLSSVSSNRKYFERIYQSSIQDICTENKLPFSRPEIAELAEMVARYTVGYGILEILLNDKRLTDLYVDAPIGQRPLYVVHSEFGQCQTNILYSNEEAQSMISKMRAMSGRPFDEAHPILDFDIPDLDTRLAMIGPPLSSAGPAFAFRLHKVTPWTLHQFIDRKFITPLGAGLLSFFVDSQSTMLVTGSRGSGKTSLMSALMLEIMQNQRVLVQEDSVTGDASIVVEREGRMEKTTVGVLTDSLIEKYGSLNQSGREILFANPESIRVFSLTSGGKVVLMPVSQFMRHKVNKKILEVTTRSGKKIKVTEDHSLFGLKNNEIQPVKTRDLRKGGFIAVPRGIDFERPSVSHCNLLDHLPKFKSGFVVGGPELRALIAGNWNAIRALAKRFGYQRNAIQVWKRNAVLPANVLSELDFSSMNPSELKLKMDKDSKPIPVIIPFTDSFLNLVGLWLADGCYDSNYAVIISSPDCLEPVQETVKVLGLKVRRHSDGFSWMISNTTLVFFLKEILGLKGDAYSKKFPDWVYGLSKEQSAMVLKGLFSGDGSVSKYETAISLVSQELIEGIQFLLLRHGIISRKHKQSLRDHTISLRISSVPMNRKFREHIGFLQEYKINKLDSVCSRNYFHDVTDVIPFSAEDKQAFGNLFSSFNSPDYVTRNYSLGRKKFGSLLQQKTASLDESLFSRFSRLLNAEVFWDEVVSVRSVESTGTFVYDFSVPGTENFVCENIIAHNTAELPVPYMKEIGFNVQHLKTSAPVGGSKQSTEVSPAEALRTGLRLGDSALIVGEVRSTEAKVLFEAMRVGAAGNIVMGTIHGDSAYSVWDRVVNDLGVPSTSFKAADIVVVARPIRFSGSLQRVRRLVQVTEVKKNWVTDPSREGGLLDLMLYDAGKDSLDLVEDNLKESDLFSKVSRLTGLSLEQIWSNIRLNAASKEHLVSLRRNSICRTCWRR